MHVFVYGTLTSSETARSVLDSFSYEGTARLVGLHRVDGEYPTLLPGGSVEGKILATDSIETLDRYEGVDRGLYVRVSIPCESHAGERDTPCESQSEERDTHVETYIGNPQRLGLSEKWPGDGPFVERVQTYLDDNDVFVRA